MTEPARVPDLIDLLKSPSVRMLSIFHHAAWPSTTLSSDEQLEPIRWGWEAAVEAARDEERWGLEKIRAAQGQEPLLAKDLVTLADCPIGLFVCDGILALKTEYGNNEGRIDAYIVESGEFFWGAQPQTIDSQRRTLVRPVSVQVTATRKD